MLIELRSDPTDPNNTPNQLFQRFKETLLLKPNTRIALVSALITTNKSNAFIITAQNNTFHIAIGRFYRQVVTIPVGNYQGNPLATAIASGIKTAITGMKADLKNYFYPDNDIIVGKTVDGFSIQVGYEPLGFVSNAPVLNASQTQVTVSNTTLIDTNAFIRSRNNGFISNTAQVRAVHSILPYANSLGTNFNGEFMVSHLATGNRGNYIGLSASTGQPNNSFIMNSVNGYQDAGGLFTHYWDRFTAQNVPAGQPTFDYDWIIHQTRAGGQQTIYYGKENLALNPNHTVISVNMGYTDPTAGYNFNYTIETNNDGFGETYSFNPGLGGIQIYSPLVADTVIARNGEATYALFERQNNDIEINYNGQSLATGATLTKLENGDSLQWLINAMDSSGPKYPIPQIRRNGTADFVNLTIDADKVIPVLNTQSYVYPLIRMDGALEAGKIGTGSPTDTNTTTAFLSNAYGVGNKSSTTTWVTGEMLYQVGTTGQGTGLGLIVVSGVAPVGTQGDITSVLCIGNDRQGQAYGNGDVINMKGQLSENTCDVTIVGTPQAITTLANAGTGYAPGLTPFSLNAGGSPANAPYPYTQGARNTRPGSINITAVGGGGEIITYTIVDGGQGFMAGDTIQINSGNTGARITVALATEDTVMCRLATIDTRNTGATWAPFEPQNTGLIDMTNDGASTLGEELLLEPLQYAGNFGLNAQIVSSSNPPHNNTTNENIMIDLPNIPINSRNAVGNTDNHIATIPYTTNLENADLETSKQHYEPYTMIYHKLDNEANMNLNHIECRLNNFDGTPREDLIHPTQLTFSLDPDYK